MLPYTVYSEAGGVGKTTLATNLAVAEARAGRDVLAIDLDPQEGSLSYLLDVPYDRADGDVDNIVRHLTGRPKGPLTDLIYEVEYGVDVIPSHNMLERLPQFLYRERQQAEQMGDPYDPYAQLYRVINESGVGAAYDTLIVDPQATAGPALYNAITATRNLVIPLEPTGKGQRAFHGLEDMVRNLESEVDIDVGVLAVVPNGVEGTRDQETILEEIEALDFPVPVVIRKRKSLLEGCWLQQCSAFSYVDTHRDRQRDYELDTLDQFDTLAAHLRDQVVRADVEVHA